MAEAPARTRVPIRACSRLTAIAVVVGAIVGGIACTDLFGPGAHPGTVWIRSVGDSGGWIGMPAVAGGRAFFVLGPDLVAVSALNGQTLWRLRITYGPTAQPQNVVVRDGQAITNERLGVFVADAATGHVIWNFVPPVLSFGGGVAVDSQAVYIGTGQHVVYALARADGHVLWSRELDSTWTYSSGVGGLVTSGDTLYVGVQHYLTSGGGQSTGIVIALDRRTGAELWRYETPEQHDEVAKQPRVLGRLLLVPDYYGGGFFVLDRFTGQRLWRAVMESGSLGANWAPIVESNRVFAGDSHGNVYAYDLATGQELWKRNFDDTFVQDVEWCDGRLAIDNTYLHVAAPTDGTDLGEVILPGRDAAGSGLAVADGIAYVEAENHILAFRCR